MATHKTFLALESIRDAKALESMMRLANKEIAGRNQAVYDARQGEICRPVEWGKIKLYLKLAVRDDATKLRESYELAKNGEQVDHIFEIRYFAAIFLHTVAETILSDKAFFPKVADISFAVNIVNHGQNLLSTGTDFHKFKTAYFTAGNMRPEFSEKLFKYLVDAAPKFRKAVDQILETVKKSEQFEHHYGFRVALLKNLLTTPWCAEDQWLNILKGDEPFSKNLTLTNYVSDDFVDDNVFHKV